MISSPFTSVPVLAELTGDDTHDLLDSSAVTDAFAPLLHERPSTLGRETLPSVVLGELIGIADDGLSPLVTFPQAPSHAAVRARSVVDLHGIHIGQQVTLVFEQGDAARPIVTGVLRTEAQVPVETAGQLEIETDGRRMLIQAREHLVLRCGKASITLTRAGKVLIDGSYVLTRSTGMNRIKGGAVQIN